MAAAERITFADPSIFDIIRYEYAIRFFGKPKDGNTPIHIHFDAYVPISVSRPFNSSNGMEKRWER